jgi:sec-independent protein translocase protein TatB
MGIGFLELVIIALAGLVVLGPHRIPELLRQVAKFYVHLKRTSNDLKSAFDHVVHEAEAQLKDAELPKAVITSNMPTRPSPAPVSQDQVPEQATSKPASSPRADGTASWDLSSENNRKESE